ncbi:MAG: mechanosensitive ion channel family protein, partial [Luteolibacter sp.]
MINKPLEPWLALISDWGLRLLAAVFIFVIGRIVAKILTRTIRKLMEKRQVEPALVSFASSLVFALMMIFVVLASIAKLGIQTTSLVAMLGAAGLAIGLALQGSLSNFAAGVLILLFSPFRIGDYIEAGGTAGNVEEIGILFTEM